MIAGRALATLMPNGLRGPYSESSVRPATIVGSANGRSISPLTMRLPGKSSRTSTHAINVPVTALMSTTRNEAKKVSWIAASAWGAVMASMNEPSPFAIDCHRSAAIGMRTISPR